MSWTTLPSFRPHHPPHYNWLNIIGDNLQYLYDTITPRSYGIPEPLKDIGSSGDPIKTTKPLTWDASFRTEYAFVRTERRWLWYRYPPDYDDDLPHITYALGFGSSRHENGFTLDPEEGADAWNVQDLDAVDDLLQGMIFVVHSVRCAMLRDQLE